MPNSSFKNFHSFSATINNTSDSAKEFNDSALANDMLNERAEFLQEQTRYDQWAAKTLLGDSVYNLNGVSYKFSDLFAVEVGDMGQHVIVFNPSAKNGSSWSKNEGGFVNALLTAFGTQRYAELHHGKHARKFDKSLVIEHNVQSAFDKITGKWQRFDWKNRRFVQSTPYFKSPAGAGWLSKHIEIDQLLLALIGDQSIRYNFFNKISWDRFGMNVLDNMNSTIAKVNIQLANQAEMSQTLRKIDRDVKESERLNSNTIDGQARDLINPTSVVIDGIDLKTLGETVWVEIKWAYSKNPVKRPISTTNAEHIDMIVRTQKHEKCEYVKLVK